jgi:hypothetical protein
LLVVVLGYSSAATAEDIADSAALAAALEHVKSTLENGLNASERIGKPISAKFALEDGTLQLSLWLAREDGFAEIILYPAIRSVTETKFSTFAIPINSKLRQPKNLLSKKPRCHCFRRRRMRLKRIMASER